MARYRKIDVRMWGDEKFQRLSRPAPNGQSLFQYLLTSPASTSVPGLFKENRVAIADELGWPLEGFDQAFAELLREGLVKADWKARVIWIPGSRKYNPPESPNVVRSWRVSLDEVPECALKDEAILVLRAFAEGLGEGFAKAFGEAMPKTMPNPRSENREQDPRSENREPPAFAGVAGVSKTFAIGFDSSAMVKIFSDGRKAAGGGTLERLQRSDYDRAQAAVAWASAQPEPRGACERSVAGFLRHATGKEADGWPFWAWANDPGRWHDYRPTASGRKGPSAVSSREEHAADVESENPW